MSLIKFESIEELAEVAAEMIAAMLQEAIRARGFAHIALSGGGTPKPVYQALAHHPLRWEKIHVWWADERCVPPSDSGSNYHMAAEALLNKVGILPDHIHRVKGELNPIEGVADYTLQLSDAAEPGGLFPRLDVAILGMGGDGHTASLFPGTMSDEELVQPVRRATAEYQGRPAERITLTPLILNSSRQILFLVTGDSKAEALAAVFGERDLVNRPVQRIMPLDGETYWIVDKAAGALLSSL